MTCLRVAPLALALVCSLCAADAVAQVDMPAGKSRPEGQKAVSLPWAQSAWVVGHNSTARLVAGTVASSVGDGVRSIVAGVEIRLSEGWKTYWRQPGDDGGMPPSFQWSGSRNVKSAKVLYPAPERMKSIGGTSIGYTKAVVFPVEIEPADPRSTVELSLVLEYGICREICVPAEAHLRLTVEPTLASLPPDLSAALARVPRPLSAGAQSARPAGEPKLAAASAALAGTAPSLVFEISPGKLGPQSDLLVEAPDGIYLPMTLRVGETGAGHLRFRIDLKGVEDVARLAGKTLRLTIVGAGGGAETTWVVR